MEQVEAESFLLDKISDLVGEAEDEYDRAFGIYVNADALLLQLGAYRDGDVEVPGYVVREADPLAHIIQTVENARYTLLPNMTDAEDAEELAAVARDVREAVCYIPAIRNITPVKGEERCIEYFQRIYQQHIEHLITPVGAEDEVTRAWKIYVLADLGLIGIEQPRDGREDKPTYSEQPDDLFRWMSEKSMNLISTYLQDRETTERAMKHKVAATLRGLRIAAYWINQVLPVPDDPSSAETGSTSGGEPSRPPGAEGPRRFGGSSHGSHQSGSDSARSSASGSSHHATASGVPHRRLATIVETIIGGQVSCFLPQTLLKGSSDMPLKASSLQEGQTLKSTSGALLVVTGMTCQNKCERKVVQLVTSSHQLTVTVNHRFIGFVDRRNCIIQADQLKAGDKIICAGCIGSLREVKISSRVTEIVEVSFKSGDEAQALLIPSKIYPSHKNVGLLQGAYKLHEAPQHQLVTQHQLLNQTCSATRHEDIMSNMTELRHPEQQVSGDVFLANPGSKQGELGLPMSNYEETTDNIGPEDVESQSTPSSQKVSNHDKPSCHVVGSSSPENLVPGSSALDVQMLDELEATGSTRYPTWTDFDLNELASSLSSSQEVVKQTHEAPKEKSGDETKDQDEASLSKELLKDQANWVVEKLQESDEDIYQTDASGIMQHPNLKNVSPAAEL